MAVISIVGTSGVGKSFLVKQLASLNCSLAFFEGELGGFPGFGRKNHLFVDRTKLDFADNATLEKLNEQIQELK